MKKTALFLLATSLAVTASAQQAATAASDSTAVELDELVVEGRTQRVVKFGVEYTPDKRMKKSAIDATGLLLHMQIPQLNITPGSSSVKTLAGKDVAMFIDHVRATAQDLEGLRPEDVLRVEVLQYPDDPRFESAPYVVNFIMQHYEWGGYTKLTARGGTLARDFVNGNVYSKFATGNWTFDASAQGGGNHNDKFYRNMEETFRDINIGTRHFDELRRTSSTDSYLSKANSQWASLRAVWRTDKSYVQHLVSYSRNATPVNRSASSVRFSADVPGATTSHQTESSQTLSPSVSGYYWFQLPADNFLDIYWNFSYASTIRNSLYTLEGFPGIVNDNREKAYAPNGNVSWSKRFRHDNTFKTTLITYNTLYDTGYEGSYNGRQKLLSSENMLFLEYMQNWKFGLSLYSRVGASFVVGRVNGVNTLKQWNPRLGAQLQYKINDKHWASIEGWWGNSHPQPSSANTAIVQSNELMWLQGNPDLRNTIFASTSATYSYVPTNWVSLAATAGYEGNPDKQAYEYFSLPGYDGLVRRSVNSGNYNDYYLYASATFKLLKNSLVIKASGSGHRAVLTGIDARKAGWVTGSLNASYYLGNFSLMLYYSTPSKSISAWNNGEFYSTKCTYGLNATYSVGDFKASLGYNNWFSKGEIYGDFTSDRYSFREWEWNNDMTKRVSLTLSYTFTYGKKLNRNNELENSGGAGSAILK